MEKIVLNGDILLKEIATSASIKGISHNNPKLNRQFYLLYPQLGQTVSEVFKTQMDEPFGTKSTSE